MVYSFPIRHECRGRGDHGGLVSPSWRMGVKVGVQVTVLAARIGATHGHIGTGLAASGGRLAANLPVGAGKALVLVGCGLVDNERKAWQCRSNNWCCGGCWSFLGLGAALNVERVVELAVVAAIEAWLASAERIVSTRSSVASTW